MNIKNLIMTSMVVLSLTACGDKTQETNNGSKQTVKIGAILPLSGPQATMGEASKAGMLKAYSELNKDDLKYNYELVFEDNQGKLPTMPAVTNKVVSQDKVDTIGTITSAFAKVIAPITDQHGVLLWDFSFEDINYKPFAKYSFNQGISTQDIADATYKEFIQGKTDSIAVFAENLGVIGLITSSLEEKLKKENVNYVMNNFNPGERDFRLTIAKNKENGFTKFLIFSMPPERDIIAKQLLEAGIVKTDFYPLGEDMSKVADFNEGMKTVTYHPGTQEFNDEILNEYNLGSTYGSAAFYDYVNLVVDAYEHLYKEGSKPSAEELTAYIHARKKYKCMSGECEVKDNGFILNPVKIRQCQDGRWHTVD